MGSGATKRTSILNIQTKEKKAEIKVTLDNNKERFSRNNKMEIKVINVQGLSRTKIIEIEKLINENTLLCLTETQQKLDNNIFSKGIEYEISMRSKEDRKGGGVMLIRKNKQFNIERIQRKNVDMMLLKRIFRTVIFDLYIVYMSTNDNKRNDELYKELQQKINQSERKNIFVGDFNGHTVF